MAKQFTLGFKIEVTGGSQSASQVGLLEKALKELKASSRAADETANRLKDAYNLSDADIRKLRDAMDKLNKKTEETGKSASVLEGVFQGVGQQIGRNLVSGVENLASALPREALKSFTEFDANIRQAGVVSGSTEKQIAGLRAEATRLGIETSKTPAEISAMTIQLSKAGFTAEEQIDALEGIVRAAEATGEGLGLVGDTIGKTIRTFGLAASESGRVADLLTATANNTNSSISSLGESLQYLGPVAAAANQPLDDTLILLGLLGDQGIQGSQAGTNLATALERLKIASAGGETQFDGLVRGSARMTEAFNEIGAEARNADGSMKSVTEILPVIQQNMKGFSQQDTDVLMKALFGVEGGRAFQALLNTSPGRIALVTAEVKNSQDVAKESGEALLRGLGGAINLFTGSVGSGLVEVGKFLAVGVEPAVRAATALINLFLKLPAPVKSALVATATFTVVLGLAAATVAAYTAVQGGKIVADTLAAIATARATIATIANTLADKAAIAGKSALLVAYQANIGVMLVSAIRSAIDTGWTIAGTVATKIAAAAKLSLALATGKATAAQLAQTVAVRGNIASLAKGGLAAGLFVGAAASVALVADTFGKVTEQAGKTRESIAKIETALANIGTAKTEDAATNIDAIRESIGPVQRALDDYIRGPIPLLATATEAASNRSQLAFNDLISKTVEVGVAGRQIAGQLEEGIEVDPQKVKATVESIDAALEALRQQAPTTDAGIEIRDNQIESFEALKERILGTTDGVVAMDEASGVLAERMKGLKDALDDTLGNIDLNKLKAQALILEKLARGEITQESADTRVNNLESETLKQRFEVQRKGLVQLRELQAAAREDPEKLAEINDQIRAAEKDLTQTRIDLAQETVDGRKDADKATEANDKEASEIRVENAKKEADGIKATREDTARDSERTFKNETQLIERANEDNEKALEDSFDDQAQDRKDAVDKQIKLIEKGLDAEEKALEDSLEAQKDALDDKQEVQSKAWKKALRDEKDALDDSLDAQKDAQKESFEAAKKALDDRQKLAKTNADKGFDKEEQKIDRQLELRNADPADREDLKDQFKEEDRLARERESAMAPLEAERRRFEEQQAAETEALEKAQKEAEEKLAKEAEEKQKELEAQQEAKQEEQKAEQEAAQKALRVQQEADQEAFEVRKLETIAGIKRALEDELEAKKQAFEDAKKSRDRAFQDEMQAREQAFNDSQRSLDEASAQRQASIIAAAKASPSGSPSLRVGGPVDMGELYQVHRDEFFVPQQRGTILSQVASRAVVREALMASRVAALDRSGSAANSPVLVTANVGGLLSTIGIEQRLDALIKVSKQKTNSGPAAQENYFINEPDPYMKAAEMRLEDLRLRMRGRGT